MSDGEIRARDYATGQAVGAAWRQGVFTQFEAAAAPPGRDLWLAPALVDLQINGFGGVDFQRDNLTVEELLIAARALRTAGCSRFFLTLVTDEWPKLVQRLKHLRQVRANHEELCHAIVGWHLEGPFLSAEPGFHGAHNPALMLDPTPDHIRELRAIAHTDPVLLSIAPERNGALEAITVARSLGIKISLGHTNASLEVLREAVKAGATGFTHLGNACPQLLDRHDNILWRVLDTPGLTVSLIPDQVHVSPPLFRLVHRALSTEAIYYTTDAMAAAGALPGRYTIGALEVEVGPDQIVRQPGKSNYAGSALQPIEGAFHAARMLGHDWRRAWDGFSIHPARFMGISGGLTLGCPADFCLVQTDEGGGLESLRVYSGGKETL